MIAPKRDRSFPSEAWFESLAADASEEPDRYRTLGVADFRLAVEIVGPGCKPRMFGLVFDGYDVSSAGELDDMTAFDADATISGPLEVWQDMLSNIVEHRGADRQHTLNALSIADAPMAVTAEDPLGKDKFFRYAQTLQCLFDASAKLALAEA